MTCDTDPGARRVLLYSHDTYGLGHLRRSLVIAERLAGSDEKTSVLIATGSPRAPSFDSVCGVDLLKLPSVVKASDGSYATRTLRLAEDAVARLRASILTAAALEFRPDAVLVDHAPSGYAGELRPMFDALKARRQKARFVLGLRDVIDAADVVSKQWERDGAFELIDRFYDRVLVYGDPAVLTTAQELDLPARLGARLSFTGYVSRDAAKRPARDGRRPRLLATTGGGGDGHGLLRAVARFAASFGSRPPFDLDVVTGPFLSQRRVADLKSAFANVDGVDLREFVEDFEATLASCDAVVGMAGYNTTMEILRSGVPALLVPRTTPRREQAIRAERLAAIAPRLRAIPLETLCDADLRAFVDEAFATKPTPTPPSPPPLRMDGAERAAADVLACVVEAPNALAAGRSA
jgi:predicted glycosyltransferase